MTPGPQALTGLRYSNLLSKLVATNPQAALDELAIFYTPEMFGAGPDSNSDDTAALLACYTAAIADGKHVFLRRQYRTGGLVLPGTTRGVLTMGRGGLTVKREFANQTGLMPVDTGQDYVLKLGIEASGGDHEQFHWVNATIDGDNKTTKKGLIVFCKASQCQFDNYSLHRNRGPAVFAQKMEDVYWNSGRMVYLGNENPDAGYPRGGIVFSDSISTDGIGSNAVWFNGLRMEWIDGGFITTDHNATAPQANSVFFNALKAESYNGDADASAGVTISYGESAPNWPVVDFAKGNTGNLIGVEFNQPFFSHPENALCVARVGDCERFIVRSPTVSAGDAPICLFKIEGVGGAVANAKEFSFDKPKTRNYATSNTARKYTWSIKNNYPLPDLDLPHDGRAPSIMHLDKTDPWQHAARASWLFSSSGYTIGPEPDAVGNPCGSHLGTVGIMSGGSTAPILLRLNYLGTELDIRMGQIGGQDHLREFRLICCKTGNAANFLVALYDGSTEVPGTRITVDSSTFKEYVVYYSNLGLTGDLRLKPVGGNNAAHIFYWSKYLDRGVAAARRNAAPTTGQWAVGDMVFNSAPASGQPAYWFCSVAGTPGTWLAGPNLA